MAEIIIFLNLSSKSGGSKPPPYINLKNKIGTVLTVPCDGMLISANGERIAALSLKARNDVMMSF
ncbi:MAG: hypothetical protein IJO22_02510 [Oscillospiraceae bacterium]|nr:hypothetical protein [Oscillospiraceae bacterium]